MVKYVIKRNGTRQPVNYDKIRARFVNKGTGLNHDFINFDVIVKKVSEGIYQGTFFYHFTNLLSLTLPAFPERFSNRAFEFLGRELDFH